MNTLEEVQDNTIGVFFCGQSPEHEISIITGEFIVSEMKKMGAHGRGSICGSRWNMV